MSTIARHGFFLFSLSSFVLFAQGSGLSAKDDPIRFNRDIRPILSDTCFLCHGFDSGTRKAEMRLDIRDFALRETKNGVTPIVPGDVGKSEMIRRIFDESEPMPPKKSHKTLTKAQKELLRRWVAEGAIYEPHWAYAPLSRPALPAEYAKEHPVDAFIHEKLKESGLKPSPSAPDHALQRRLSLDLTGLPPSVALAGSSLKAPGKIASIPELVDALLESPHFGERMAVWWLDIARFADTVGFHGDQNQRIFPYRDYVIDAFRSNKPFDQFTREQLAGDLLPHPTTEQMVATGYNRLNMMTREGGAQQKEYLAKYGAERVRSVSAAWFGSTFGCAECHDHKFDPIKTRDFYELEAFFADIKQWGVYSDYGYTPEPELKGFNNDYPFPPEIEVESPWLKKRFTEASTALTKHLSQSIAAVEKDTQAKAAQLEWEQSLAPFLAKNPEGWQSLIPENAYLIRNGKKVDDRKGLISEKHSVLLNPAPARGEAFEIEFRADTFPAITALRMEVASDEIKPDQLAKSLGSSITPSIKIRSKNGKIRDLSLRVGDATAKRPDYRGGVEVSGLSTGWFLPWKAELNAKLDAVWVIESPQKVSPDEKIVITLSGNHTLPVRFSISPLADIEPLQVASADTLRALSKPVAQRNATENRDATTAFLLSSSHNSGVATTAWQLAATKRSLFGGRAWSMITQATPNPLTIRILPRGNWQDETGAIVLPSTPSFLPGRIESTPDKRLTRLDLANWLTSDANPITARAVMNRLWAMLFGAGLSPVVDDLGSQGEAPSHPDLLDWLAVEFRESGWDVKHMVRLIVTSDTYQQTCARPADAIAKDPTNRLLSSQNPRRLEAEFVRDNALAIAGLLQSDEIGGPSSKPYQPAGYYEALQFPNRDYVSDADARQWRRGLYTHWQRTFLHPMMANFDAPARDECAAARTVSNTPQQALTLLNDPTFVEAARVFAAKLLRDATADDQARLNRAFHIALDRSPKAKESERLIAFLNSQRNEYGAKPEDAQHLISVGISAHPTLDPVEHAAWTQVARVLLNAQETITRY